MKAIAVIGVSGAIGKAFARHAQERYPAAKLYGFSRSKPADIENCSWYPISLSDEASIEAAAHQVTEPLDLVIVATGILHEGELQPEKSMRDLSAEKFEQVFKVNSIGPALVAKHFLPTLNRKDKAVFAALSARVGSIGDNRLGGWYAYRASKAALNMILKNASIEASRRNKQAIVVGLHPGTVDSALSLPFQGNVPEEKLFSPDYSAGKLLDVIDGLGPVDSGQVFDFNGVPMPA